MHRCLQVPELVELITSQLSVHRQNLRDLAVLARTSTVFSDHALRLLWASATLINLLRCLPSDAYSLRVKGKGSATKSTMTPRRSLQDSDFERLRFNGAYVRRLFCKADAADTSRMFRNVHPWLSASMFPMLGVVYWWSVHSEHGEGDIRFIECFLAPGLTEIHMPDNWPATMPIVSSLAIATRCPQLADLSCFSRVDPAAVSALSECVRGLDHLQSISTDVLEGPALDHLSRLTSLRQLNLHSIPADFPSPRNQPFFPSLLDLELTDFDSASRFFERGREIALTSCAVDSMNEYGPTNFSSAHEIHRLISAIEGGVSHSSLTSLTINDGYGSFHRSDAPIFTIRASSLHRLFCFNNLTHVTMFTAVGFDLDDATVVDMARSWPQIESLMLESCFGSSRPRTTLRCLEAFAQYCPRLVRLSIAFDATVVPSSEGDFYLKRLMRLEVDASPISNAGAVAQFLARMCPRLRHVCTLVDKEDEDEEWEANAVPEAFGYDTIWKEVKSILQGS
ncbi:hypothetical protein FB45DRAFT_1150168 [Roridomyces roridus]|uniref:F-box domain-containing protein n=1 Tax=Roridomyces roridus TaxID=1738132 RepID=A0AAD7BT03_9AGAR|nr:hypothetical protein FB45DRAFT_1150168 [Roridomyces roridus]